MLAQTDLVEANRRVRLCFVFVLLPFVLFVWSWSTCVFVQNDFERDAASDLGFVACDSEITCASCMQLIDFESATKTNQASSFRNVSQ